MYDVPSVIPTGKEYEIHIKILANCNHLPYVENAVGKAIVDALLKTSIITAIVDVRVLKLKI